MAFLKKNMLLILFCLVCLGSLGGAAWAYVAGDDIVQRMQGLNQLKGKVARSSSGAANLQTIAARKAEIEEKNKVLDKLLEEALSPQIQSPYTSRKRTLLIDTALPKAKSDADRINFRDEYKREFARLVEKLRGRDKATRKEIALQESILNQNPTAGRDLPDWWRPDNRRDADEVEEDSAPTQSLADVLSKYAPAKAAEVVARGIYMYVDRKAMLPHELATSDGKPSDIEIWQAQMGLWIQQDVVSALASLNEGRARELDRTNRAYNKWVAHMPVKRLIRLAWKGWLGQGGGSYDNKASFALSFTNEKNDDKKFIVPIQLWVVIEEGALMELIESLTKTSYFTPVSIETRMVDAGLLQDTYIYGEGPLLEVKLDIEAYFFREVYEDWIPKKLKSILKKPGAQDDQAGRR